MFIKIIKLITIVSITIFILGCEGKQKSVKLVFINDGNNVSDSANTINSIRRIDNLFYMNYYGSYEDKNSFLSNWILNNVDTNFISNHSIVSRDCSLFSFCSDTSKVYLSRNFDWGNGCGILLAKYSPPSKYSSIAFSRLEDMRIHRYVDPSALTSEEKMRFLYFPFYSVDGINECGLAVGIAGVNSQKLNFHPNKKPIFITHFVRQVLDNCKNVEEAIKLSKKYNLFDGSLKTISHHILITDADGSSVIIEYKDGEMRYIEEYCKNQVITNSYVYDLQQEVNKRCWRYNTIYNQINSKKEITSLESMKILEDVYNETVWSVIYDAKLLKGLFAINGNYNQLYEFKL